MIYNIRSLFNTMLYEGVLFVSSQWTALCLLYLYTLVKASHNEANERCKPLCAIVYPVTCIA